MNGKGSRRRPMLIDRKQFENNWDKIFKRRKMVTTKAEIKNEAMYGFYRMDGRVDSKS